MTIGNLQGGGAIEAGVNYDVIIAGIKQDHTTQTIALHLAAAQDQIASDSGMSVSTVGNIVVHSLVVDPTVAAYNSGVDHMATSMQAAGDGDYAMVALGALAAAGDVAGLALSAVGGEEVEAGALAVKEGIYEFTAASGYTYVGQSGNIAARLEQHLASGKLLASDLSTVQMTEVLGGKTQREIAEQLRINSLGGIQNLENKVNPIGPARQYLLHN